MRSVNCCRQPQCPADPFSGILDIGDRPTARPVAASQTNNPRRQGVGEPRPAQGDALHGPSFRCPVPCPTRCRVHRWLGRRQSRLPIQSRALDSRSRAGSSRSQDTGKRRPVGMRRSCTMRSSTHTARLSTGFPGLPPERSGTRDPRTLADDGDGVSHTVAEPDKPDPRPESTSARDPEASSKILELASHLLFDCSGLRKPNPRPLRPELQAAGSLTVSKAGTGGRSAPLAGAR
jgi:hypothetical protein